MHGGYNIYFDLYVCVMRFMIEKQNLPEGRFLVIISKRDFNNLQDKSLNIFKKSNVGCYIERPIATFCYEIYGV